MEVTIQAATIEAAIEKAVAELGAPNAEASQYTVVTEPKKGFLGIGSVPAEIKATYEPVSGGEAAALAFRKPRRESASDTRDITLFLYCERKDPVKAPLYRIRIFKSTISRSLGIKRPRRLKRRG